MFYICNDIIYKQKDYWQARISNYYEKTTILGDSKNPKFS